MVQKPSVYGRKRRRTDYDVTPYVASSSSSMANTTRRSSKYSAPQTSPRLGRFVIHLHSVPCLLIFSTYISTRLTLVCAIRGDRDEYILTVVFSEQAFGGRIVRRDLLSQLPHQIALTLPSTPSKIPFNRFRSTLQI